MEYDFETDRVVEQILESKAKRVGLQFPEGLKENAVAIAAELEEKTGAEVVIFSDPTYGACDLHKGQAERLGLDLLVHYGHTRFGP